jgi:nucleotide-binding universal stress UspA family protein
VSTLLLEGSPADAILAELDRGSYDLIVTRGLGGIAGMFLGSVSNGVLERSPVPALVVRATSTRAKGEGAR